MGRVFEYVRALGHAVEDLGTYDTKAVDYPDFAEAVAAAIPSKRVERAVLLCGSGVGASGAANKFAGIRAGLCHDTYSAHQGVEHDQINVLVLGSRVIAEYLAYELVLVFGSESIAGRAPPPKTREDRSHSTEMRTGSRKWTLQSVTPWGLTITER